MVTPYIDKATHALVAITPEDEIVHVVTFYEEPSAGGLRAIKQEMIDEAVEFGLDGVDYDLYLIDKSNPGWNELMDKMRTGIEEDNVEVQIHERKRRHDH